VKGFFNNLSSTLGAGSFNSGNEPERFAAYINSGSLMATEFREQYQLGKELHETLNFQVEAVHRLHDDENIYDKPLSGFAAGIKKVQKVIQDQRQHLKFQHAASRARRLPTYDRRRIAFIANSIFK
jgi:hypothetical protein